MVYQAKQAQILDKKDRKSLFSEKRTETEHWQQFSGGTLGIFQR